MKNVANYLLMCIVAIAMFVGYGCSQDAYVIQDDFSDVQGSLSYKELSEIAYSAEYEQYLWAKLKLNDFLTETDFDEMEFIGIINGVQVYHLDVSEPISGINNAYARLITQFPNYALANKENKLRAQNIAVLNSNRLSSALKIGKNEIGVTRSKDRTEAGVSYNEITWDVRYEPIVYDNSFDAISQSITISFNGTTPESGGFVYWDDSSIFIKDKYATRSHMNMPNFYNCTYKPKYVFHCHPGGTETPSPEDYAALQEMNSHGCGWMVIVTAQGEFNYYFQ